MFARRPNIARLQEEGDEAGLIKALRDKDPSTRAAAAGALVGVAGADSLEALTAALEDTSRSVRLAAVNVLERLGAVAPLLAAIDDKDSQVRRRAAAALANVGGERAVEPLVGALHDEDPKVRAAAVDALGTFDGDRAFAAVSGAVEDPAEPVRLKAVATIAHRADPGAAEPLLVAVGDRAKAVRHAALTALRQLDAVPDDVWMPLLDTPDAEVRKWAVEQCATVDDQHAIGPLVHALGYDPAVRTAAAQRIGKVRDPQAAQELVNRLASEGRPSVRTALRDALAHIGGPLVEKALMPANLHVNVPPPPWKEGVLPGRMKGHRPRYARIDQGDTAMSQSTCECGWSGAAGDTASGQRRWHRMHRERLLRLWRGETFPAPNLNLVKQQAGSPPAPTSQEDRAHLAWLIARAMPSHEVIQAAELPAQGLYHLDVYVPDLALAVAYLGAEQCAGESQQQVRFDASGEFVYFPDDAALSERRRTLEEMRRNCEDANVTLIEWRHDFPITEANVRERLS